MTNGNKLDITVYLGPKDAAALKNAIGFCAAKADFAILESLTRTDFPDPKTVDIDPEIYPRGRVFSESFELSWERSDGTNSFRSVLSRLTPLDKSDEGISEYFEKDTTIEREFSKGSGGTTDEYEVYLRPQKDASLGRSLDYACIKNAPHKRDANAKLKIKRYRDAWGRLIFWRYCTMRWEG